MATLDLGKVVGDAGQGIASGGATGQYLKKASSEDYDTAWESFANATQSAAGMMSATDKTKLDGLPASAVTPDEIGIVVTGNSAPSGVSASIGQYVILKNSTITGKSDGLYTAAKAIPSNTAIDGTYLTAVEGGGLNALNDQIAKIVEYKPVQGNASATFTNISVGTIIFLARASIGLWGVYCIDIVGTVQKIYANGDTVVSFSLSNSSLTISNSTGAGFACTVIRPAL